MIKFYYDVNGYDVRKLMRSTVEVLDAEYVITAELPGMKKEDIKITLEDDILTITAKRNKEEDKKYYLDERYYGEMTRTFTLKDLKDGDVKATYVDGVLTLNIPKLTEAETKKIITIE